MDQDEQDRIRRTEQREQREQERDEKAYALFLAAAHVANAILSAGRQEATDVVEQADRLLRALRTEMR